MKKYEYKVIKTKNEIGFNFDEKIDKMEKEWNELGSLGWKFCTFANGAVVFVRELDN